MRLTSQTVDHDGWRAQVSDRSRLAHPSAATARAGADFI
jgi:hypothetical protein